MKTRLLATYIANRDTHHENFNGLMFALINSTIIIIIKKSNKTMSPIEHPYTQTFQMNERKKTFIRSIDFIRFDIKYYIS